MAAISSFSALQIAQKKTVLSLAPIALQHCQYSSDVPRIIKNPTTTSLKRGTGGRSSFNGIVCTVFGNTGFVGRYVCNRLGKIGTQLILPYRGEHYSSMRLKLVGDLGQVLFHPFQLTDEDSIRKCIKYSNVVINLIGRDWQTKNFTFDDVHVHGARRLARLAKEAGVERFIHLSTLSCSPDPKPILLPKGSGFYRSKWRGEQAVKEEFPEATIVRPATIYGQEDRWINVYCRFWRRHLRGTALWEKGEKTEKQPIWVGDVAGGITALVRDPSTAGKTYQFAGPQRYKLGDLVDWMNYFIRKEAKDYGYRRLDLKNCPFFKLKVSLVESISPGYPLGNLHWDGLEKEHTSDILVPELPTLEDIGVYPCTMESRIAWELRPFKLGAHYMERVGEFPDPEPPKPIAMSPA
ncbi:NADH dehydrogenase [ubiquinone] 1 alpha subcomplex subunit 9, mitochondrial [Diachasma alloeum]|uniref:NADH dehydrogenase [ubiquinone] 1 alpha subcomplex subunit 9, mitochondrial n=1 Tax=Diachasma alloeum TaxID=454923 RepID=A0A4E0RQI1_9HYME|nr:NADH dehydrogenase [ubiquinone] 1 alpha subcomplex subunit 9, mitochondrial [Diachasma alloeum]THK33044.1 39 kDA subunit, NADH-dehydrogenase [Diachasma alloeum]